MESADPDSYCVICSNTVKFNPDSATGSASHSKLANAFIQCLTLDPAYVEDLTNSSSFCLPCKLSLEQWDSCENQILLLRRRSRQLKASLIAKLLKSPGQPIPDICSKLGLIRGCIKRRFDPQVVLEKIDSMNFSNSNETTHCKPERIQVQEDHTEPTDCGNYVQVKLEELDDERISDDFEMESSSLDLDEDPFEIEYQQQFSASTKRTQKDYEYGGVKVTVLNGKHICGRCQKCFDWKNSKSPRKNCVQHIKRCHVVRSQGVNSQGNGPPMNPIHSIESSKNLEDRPPEPTKQIKETPTFYNAPLIREVKPGEYSYRNMISFYYQDKNFTCGHCHAVISADNQKAMTRHLKTCEERLLQEVPLELSEQSEEDSKNLKATPTFTTELIKETKPGEYLFRDKISFIYKDEVFVCGRCKQDVRGSAMTMRHHLKYCEKREIPRIRPKRAPFNTDLIKQVKPGEYLYRDKISFCYQGGDTFACDRCKQTVRGRPYNIERHLSWCEKRELPLDGMPTFRNDYIKQVKPGQYLYRDKIPFYFRNRQFTCGGCYVKLKGDKDNHRSWKQHLSRCESRGYPLQRLPTRHLTCVEELPAQAGVGKPYFFHCFGAPVALKDDVFYCEECHETFDTFQDLKGHILATPSHKAEPPVTEPSMVVSQAHYAPPLMPVHKPDSSFPQTGVVGLPVMVLPPPGQQHPSETGNNRSSEPETAIVKTEDTGLIVPDITGDELEDLNRREGDSESCEIDPLQLMKIDFDCLEEEMHDEVTE